MKTKKIYIFDPTAKDPLSKTRGLGRYTKILTQAIKKAEIIADQKNTEKGSILIFPYIDPLKNITIAPKHTTNIAVIHDVIKLKYPHAFPKGKKAKFFLFLNKLFLKRFDFFITDTKATIPDLEKYLSIPKEKITVIYPAIDQTFFEKNAESYEILQKLNLPKKFCLYVGDTTYNKNLVNLAKAIKIINVTCVFVGKIWEKIKDKNFLKNLNHPELSSFKKFLEITKDDKRFIFLGYIEDRKLKSLYENAQVNVLVSIDEGFGYSPLEAGACETPSVVSNIPVFKETLENSALFVDPNDPYEIANGIGEIYFNDTLRNQLGKRAKKQAKKFTLENFRKNLLEFLSSL